MIYIFFSEELIYLVLFDFYFPPLVHTRRVGAGMEGPLRACSIIKRREKAMETRENLVQSGLREAAIRHQEYAEGATLYAMERHPDHGMVCMVPSK